MLGKVHTLLAGVLLTPVLVSAAVSPVASGQTSRAAQRISATVVDARGDVYRSGVGQTHRVPRNHHADIDRVRVTHDHQTVVVRTKLFHLRREGIIQISIGVHTPELTGRNVTLSAWKDNRRGAVVVVAGSHLIDCPTSHRIDYVNDVMIVRLARLSCL